MSETRVVTADRLTAEQADRVEEIAGSAQAADGVAPLGEQFLLRLRGDGDGVTHLLGHRGDEVAGYAQLDPHDPAGAAGELVVAADARRHGVGRALVAAAERTDPRLRVWAHGGLPAAAAFAERLGFAPVRSLWQMRLALADVPDLPEPVAPDGLTVRLFRPGADERAWLEVNARAFASHPEQGRVQLADLEARERADWFDPEGFFLAERDDRLVGFHWTKVEDGVGEVYVIGVDPGEQGTGLGKVLLLTGLAHLRDRGLDTVTLYVESDNTAAVGLYRKLGFVHGGTDTMYARRA
ncbi:MAG: mycothiol synthase [Streptosporangiales bacterium]|nr:mycothiol synthase [Streptosporangiales bacterium]